MKELKTKKGVLKYKAMDVFDAARVISALLNPEKENKSVERDVFKVAVDLIDHTSIGYSSKIEMQEDLDTMLEPLYTISNEMINEAMKAWDKKKE